MSKRQAVRFLGAYLWRRERWGFIITLLFALYMGAVLSLSIDEIVAGENVNRFFYGLVDWIYLTMLPVFGLAMNRSALGMWRKDVYSKRIAYWRTMPIPVAAIVLSRLLQSTIALSVIGVFFVALQYVLAPHLRAEFTLPQWLESGAIWLCYAFVINALYLLLELGYNGKKYVQWYFGYMGLSAIAVTLLNLWGANLFTKLLNLTDHGPYVVVLIGMALLALVVTWVGCRMTIVRIRSRSIKL
jgi:hypothetical protein